MRAATVPKALKPGDTIAFVSPSSRLNEAFPTPLTRAIKYFEAKGYLVKTIYTPITSSPETPRFSSKARHVANELHEAFLDDTVSCIISTCGGTEANEILRYLDYELIRAHPKIFVGYSDNTMLIYALFVKAGLRCFYGPCIFTEFAEFPQPDSFTTDHFFQMVTGQAIVGQRVPTSTQFVHAELPFFTTGKPEDTQEIRSMLATPTPKFIRSGSARGPILGGCLRKIVALYGSPFLQPEMHQGAILFLEISGGEDGPMPLYRVRADLVDLMNTGLFDHIVGLVFGRTLLYDEKLNNELEALLVELAESGPDGGYKWPLLFGVDIGHTSPMLTIPFGAQALLDSSGETFAFLESGVQ